jgi:hypothetical protein
LGCEGSLEVVSYGFRPLRLDILVLDLARLVEHADDHVPKISTTLWVVNENQEKSENWTKL